MDIIKGLEPAAFWKHFYNLTRIPHESGNEEGVRNYVCEVAEKYGHEYKIDKIGNIVIKRKAAASLENKPSVVLQGHMDMVCEKNRDTVHDFERDPIPLIVKDGWLMADGTTLGADNGVAVAAGLAILESGMELGPVEILLTVDEETGLTGAKQLDASMVESRILINLDSEEDGVIYVGCAGGKNTDGYIPVEMEKRPDGYRELKVKVTGLKGGHSGGEIHLGLGNANVIGARFLWNSERKFNARLVSIDGGGKHNAIPREFFAEILVKVSDAEKFLRYAEEYSEIIRNEYKLLEENLNFSVEPVVSTGAVSSGADMVYSPDSQRRILNLLYTLPHGVMKMSPVLKNLVETSTNFARAVLLESGEFFVQNCNRSSVDSECDDIADKIKACISAAGGRSEFNQEYPGWAPNPDSAVLKTAQKAYSGLFGKDAEVKAIHAGLECGVIGNKFDAIDMISIGPELADVHTPGEKMHIESVEKVWKFLVEILKLV